MTKFSQQRYCCRLRRLVVLTCFASICYIAAIHNRVDPVSEREKAYLNHIAAFSEWETTERERRLPDVILIGVEKCGARPLHWMMAHHPMMVGSDPPELLFFETEKENKGKEYYKNLMPEVTDYELVLVNAPAYFGFGPRNLPMQMKKTVPNAKLILILCDPVNRAYSDFYGKTMMGPLNSDATFETVMTELLAKFSEMPKNSDSAATDFIYKIMGSRTNVVSTGLYYYHLLRWFEAYNRSEIHIVEGKELLDDPGSVMEKVQTYLKIPMLIIKEDFVRDQPGFYCMNIPTPIFTESKIKLERPKDPECIPLHPKEGTRMGTLNLWEVVMDRLRKFFAPHNEKLYDLIGRKFDWQQPSL